MSAAPYSKAPPSPPTPAPGFEPGEFQRLVLAAVNEQTQAIREMSNMMQMQMQMQMLILAMDEDDDPDDDPLTYMDGTPV